MAEPAYEYEVITLDFLYDRAKGICCLCGRKVRREDASREHLIPRSLGGPSTLENLDMSHKTCNNNRGNGYRSIYSQHHALDGKEFTVLEEHGLLIQVVPDPNGGMYLILGKKKDYGFK